MTDIDAVCEVVVQAKNAEIEKLLTELVDARPIVAAAMAWRAAILDGDNYDPVREYATSADLSDAIDAARGKL